MSSYTPKSYSKLEENINVVSHGVGFVFSLIGLVLLVLKASQVGTAITIVSVSIYGVSLILLYAASTTYHAAKTPTLRERLNIFDHASIYVLIAGTYTPFTLLVLDGWVGWTIFGISWGIALLGVILKLFFTGQYDRVSTIAYVVMGWIIVLAINPLMENLVSEGLWLLLAGGVSYTLGAVLYSINKLPFNHAIFHFFVLFGSLAHFMAVYFFVL
ncbi:MAG: hemolysin III family protein [Flavobacteriaceae bacterium]|nr:hemolysin III family protein [Flavobacteriaceae bacterium]